MRIKCTNRREMSHNVVVLCIPVEHVPAEETWPSIVSTFHAGMIRRIANADVPHSRLQHPGDHFHKGVLVHALSPKCLQNKLKQRRHWLGSVNRTR